jgi:cytochrome P450
MPKLPYLSAVIKETLRMHPAVPIVLRKLVEARSIGGAPFAAGDIVGIAVPAIHFNPDVWPDPYRFDPVRFLDHSPTPFEYLPFGGGHRRCPGAAFASDEMAIAIGTIMRTVPRGIAVVPRRDVEVTVAAKHASAG